MRPTCRRAFTLIELIVVIAIVSILMGLLFSALAAANRTAKISAAKTQLSTVATALEQYRLDFGSYPPDHFPTANGAEVLAWHLCRRHTQGDMHYGPYLDIAVLDRDKNGFNELYSSLNTPYYYVITLDEKGRERGYLSVDCGWDRKLGGTMDPIAGFATYNDGDDADNFSRP